MASRISVLVIALMTATGALARPHPQKSGLPFSTQLIALGDRLHSGGDWRLSGPAASALVRFALPPRSEAVAGSTLHLFLSHSDKLDGDRSFLTVTLNYGILRSVRLDATNADMTEIVVEVPPASVRQNNQLVFSVEQYSPQSGSPLTVISARSFLEMHSIRVPMEWNLASLHEAATSPAAYGPERISVLLPDRPSSSTLEAIALLVAGLSHRAGQEQPALNVIHDVRRSDGLTLVVGTPLEQPSLTALANTPLTFYRNGLRTLVGGNAPETVNQTDGFIQLRSSPSGGGPVMLVTGNSPAAVLNAARALVGPTWRVADNFARISTSADWSELAPRHWDGFLPVRNSFQLRDLHEKNLPIAYPDGVLISLNATPDAIFLPYAHQIILKLALAAQFRVPEAEIVVQLNGTELTRFNVDERFRTGAASLPVAIPARLLRTTNLLKVSWQGPAPAATDGTAGWVLGGSEFYLPRYYKAQLPELGLLQASFYPFSLRADFSDVLLIVPDRTDAAIVAVVLDLARVLARMAPADHLAFHLTHWNNVTADDLARYDLILLHPGSLTRLPSQLVGAMPHLPLRSGSGRDLRIIRELISPWNRDRYVLVINAESPAALSALVDAAFSPERMAALSGDTAVIEPAGTRCFALAPRQELREFSYNLALQAWLRAHWTALPLVLISVSGGLFVVVRLLLRQWGTPRFKETAHRI